MRIHFLAAAALSLFAACTDDASIGTTDGGAHAIVTAVQPSGLQMTQPEATAACQPLVTHAPSTREIQTELGDCVRTSIGFLCKPLSVAAETAPIAGGLELAQVWTSTPCEHGFFLANFDTGEITCQNPTTTHARALCLHD